ncbi:MAG TPA: cytochrome c [Gemmatimonadaceae bacterium]|nr:cytochrome c [Gemmatimonadaceae bacterium]
MKRQTQYQPRATTPALAFLAAALLLGCGGSDTGANDDTTPVSTPPVPVATAVAQSGEQLYQRCMTCHQANGQGSPGVFPPLAGSEYATAANVAVPIRIVIRGMQGPIIVKGGKYDGLMPAYGVGIEMSDEEVAAVLTYVRQSWGNTASAVTSQDVAKERAAQTTKDPVTAAELKTLM